MFVSYCTCSVTSCSHLTCLPACPAYSLVNWTLTTLLVLYVITHVHTQTDNYLIGQNFSIRTLNMTQTRNNEPAFAEVEVALGWLI